MKEKYGWYMYTHKGQRVRYWGIATANSTQMPSKNAFDWKWSNGSYCYV